MIFKEIESFSKELKERFGCDVYLYGSFARGEIHEGSDIDLIIVGDFKERFFDRIGKILELTVLLFPFLPHFHICKDAT